MKRHESRNISRSRYAIEALSPCTRYSSSAGVNPFSSLLQSSGIADKNKTEEELIAEKHMKHQLKMAADQKSAKARQQRKRNKV
jgi:hypothetical protein